MIYLKRMTDTEIREFADPAAALDFISAQSWNPGIVQAWVSESGLIPVEFEDLNRLAGRPYVLPEVIREEVTQLVEDMDRWFSENRGWRIQVEDMDVSTGGIPTPSSVVRMWFGNPMAKLTLVARMDDHLIGGPPKITAQLMRMAIRGVESAGGPTGWHVLTADGGKVALQTGLEGRTMRRHVVMLSKRRIEFTLDLPSEGTTPSTSPPEMT
jgi:hypothetical protein